MLERLASIDRRYKDLVELAKLRKQRLLDALSLYKLFNEADGVEQWIEEKVSLLSLKLVCTERVFQRQYKCKSLTGENARDHGDESRHGRH